MIISEAPCKIILFGEHSVVYGYPAIASAISLKTYVEIEEINGGTELYSYSIGQRWVYGENETIEYKPLIRIIKYFEDEYNINLSRGLKITIRSDVKPGSGLGTSASVAAALTGALFKYINKKPTKEEVNKIAYEAEKIAHGKPSGIDNSVAVYGGVIKFVKKENSYTIDRIESTPNIDLVIIDTGLGRSTKVAVEKVYKLYSREKNTLTKIFESIGLIAEEAWNELHNTTPDRERLGRLMDINHGLLSAIGVSNYKIEEIINKARELGALGAKITGAGLGGFVIVLPKEREVEEIVTKLSKIYQTVYSVKLEKEGVRVYET